MDQKISNLIELTEFAVEDELVIVDKNIGETKKVTISTLDTRYVNVTGDTMTGDLTGTDFVRTRDGTITRVSGYVSEVALTGGRTLTVTRNASNFITSITDTIRTWTYTRDANDYIISWAVT